MTKQHKSQDAVSREIRAKKPKSWRDVVKVHPAADLFPMMDAAELKALGKDIRKHGLRIPTIWWRDRSTDQVYLLDGRNRLDALEAIGRTLVNEFAPDWEQVPLHLNREDRYELGPSRRDRRNGDIYPDPYEYVLSANIHRRHLTTEQKRELISKVLKAQPGTSDRQIAKITKTSDKTVTKVRKEMEARSEFPNVSTRTDTKGRAQPAKKPKTRPITTTIETTKGTLEATKGQMMPGDIGPMLEQEPGIEDEIEDPKTTERPDEHGSNRPLGLHRTPDQ